MISVASDSLALTAEARGWTEDDPPAIGDVVELGTDTRTSDDTIAVVRRRTSS
jgi:hypothetical protein